MPSTLRFVFVCSPQSRSLFFLGSLEIFIFKNANAQSKRKKKICFIFGSSLSVYGAFVVLAINMFSMGQMSEMTDYNLNLDCATHSIGLVTLVNVCETSGTCKPVATAAAVYVVLLRRDRPKGVTRKSLCKLFCRAQMNNPALIAMKLNR